MRRSSFAFVLASLAVCACGGAQRPYVAPGVQLWETEDHTSEGDVVVPGDPGANYAMVGDLQLWPKIFSDVARVEAQGRDEELGEDKVLLVTTEGQNNNLRFTNDPSRHVVRFHDTGGAADVWAEISFEPAARGMTRIHVKLHADVHGITSLFVTDAHLRHERQKKLSSDLTDMQRFFNTAARSP
ncbi:MAG TPA: SRPBCC family protein [Kofleriaceae bacterium]|nr:SRPBCC family protein [Kofleriaceae bacterium]